MDDLTNIYQRRTEDTTRYHWSDYLGAILFAACIGMPFAIYLWRM